MTLSDVQWGAVIAIALPMLMAIFQLGRLSERVDHLQRDVRQLTDAVRELETLVRAQA